MPNTQRRFTRTLAALLLSAGLAACAATETSQSSAELLENEALVAKVKTEMAQSDLETLLDVEVESFRGTVQLSGMVETQEEKDAAEEAARRVEGIVEIENDILVKSEL